jgi:hypothetical protein
MGESFHTFINDTFGPALRPFFHAISSAIEDMYMPWARIFAVGLFIAAMVWVYTLRPEYVNLDAPRKVWYTDLRVWTVLAMLPHVFVYLFV